MEGTGGSSASATAAAGPPVNQWVQEFSKLFQHYLDKSTPHSTYRWIGTFVIASIYVLRVFYIQGFYIVSYGLGIYMLNLLIGFLSPLVDPELEPSEGGPLLPTKGSDEFKPFIRRLPEFKFWYSFTKAFCIAFLMTFFSVFDVPVFWPILLCYWVVLFVLTMRRQIAHMIKYRYIPFSLGKQKYGGKKSYGSSSGGSRAD
ncbi:protein RER1A-like [Trifolium pratense]|uniref:Uncharacterized protein n=2 Tax=Trifolium pratense TaxID=57577 RepID=A0ACB0ME63_TRIPR|nr:protein RER1A-like [Trifolium pratense]CAJ2679287.1 unnamed protein product [Trifolium pratense]